MDQGQNAVFAGKTALIYGAAKGIGRAVAREFARRGASIAIADIDLSTAEETARLIASAGGRAIAMRCDVTSDASVRENAVAAEIALGEIDIVMNNVGCILHGNPEDIPFSEWQRIWDINFMSVVRSNSVFLPKMIARRTGFIVNTASDAGLYPFATNRMPYAAAKAAVVALTESMALHLQPQGVRVSCLCPGPVMTDITERMKTWSVGVEMCGPGSHIEVKMPEDVACTLADGMEAGRIIIPTHAEIEVTMARHWTDPDAFIHSKIEEFARGDFGRPSLPAGFKPPASR